MKKSRFNDEQKIAILKEVRAGATVVATCAKHNLGVETYHGWKRKFGGMEVDEPRR
jgi:putative transposase